MLTFNRVVVAVCVLLASASAGEGQPRDPAAAGGARIRGRVVASDTGVTLPGVRVSLEATRLLDTPLSSVTRTTTTDGGGTFDFPDLPFGDYRLATSKTGYLIRPTGRGPAANGYPVVIRQGDRPEPVTIQMIRAGAIEGRLLDMYGEPAPRVRVSAERYQYASDGQRNAVVAGVSDVTDDLGQFRVYGLPAGDFRVIAADAGPPSQVWPSPVTQPRAAPTYYPGTINAEEAQVVSLPPGGEVALEFAVMRARLVTVKGMILRSDGAPAAGLSVKLRSSTTDSVSVRSGGTTGIDGTFEIAGVAPGQYWIDADNGRLEISGESASTAISVSTDDLAGVTLVTSPGATIRGTVEFEGPRRRPDSFQLTTVPINLAEVSMFRRAGADQGRVLATGGFEIAGVSGRVVIRSDYGGWTVTSVIVDGEEHVDAAIDTAGRATIEGVRVTVTSRESSVTGRVTDGRGRALTDHIVVLLRTEPTALVRQRIRVVRTDAAGRFSIDQLRSGTYAAAAFEDLEENYHFSPEFQERLRLRGHGFVLGEGVVTLDLVSTAGLP